MTYPYIKAQRTVDLTDWFDGMRFVPVHEGYYMVVCHGVSHRSRFFLTARPWRYWNGSEWLTDKDGAPSIFGRHPRHQFRGLKHRQA